MHFITIVFPNTIDGEMSVVAGRSSELSEAAEESFEAHDQNSKKRPTVTVSTIMLTL